MMLILGIFSCGLAGIVSDAELNFRNFVADAMIAFGTLCIMAFLTNGG